MSQVLHFNAGHPNALHSLSICMLSSAFA